METTYRDILAQTFHERSMVNSRYSMRSFARDLEVPPSTLSEVLNGKKGISVKRSGDLAIKLKLPEWQAQLFCDLVAIEHAKSPLVKKEAGIRLKDRMLENKMRLINHTALLALTSWVDLAILELTYLKDFQGSYSWIAKKINVEQLVVEHSVQRLLNAKLLEIDKVKNIWSDVSPLFSTTDGIPNENIRNFHKSVLQLGVKKLDNQDTESRTVKSVVFSVSESNKEKAKKILDEAISKIVALADESSQERDEVMCFSGQLFSLIENKGKNQ